MSSKTLPRRTAIVGALTLLGWRPVFDVGMDRKKDTFRLCWDYQHLGRQIHASGASNEAGWKAYAIKDWHLVPENYAPVEWAEIPTSVLRSFLTWAEAL